MGKRLKGIVRQICAYAPIVFLSLFIASNLYLGVSKAVTGEPVPKILGFSPLVVLSGSMEPALYPGDIVLIRRIPKSGYEVGDIVTYLDGGTVFTHRIIGFEGGSFLLKGDSNNVADDWVSPNQLEGKVIARIPYAGRVILFLKKPAGMAALSFALLLFFYSDDLIKIKDRYLPKGSRGGDG